MFTAVAIQKFRGVRDGEIKGLTPFTILTGKNNSGKTTLLEALYLVAGGTEVERLGTVARRRGWFGVQTVPYLTFGKAPTFDISATDEKGAVSELKVVLEQTHDPYYLSTILGAGKGNTQTRDLWPVRWRHQSGSGPISAQWALHEKHDLDPIPMVDSPVQKVPTVFVDNEVVRAFGLVEDAYSKSVEKGSYAKALELLRAIEPRLTDLRIIKREDKHVLDISYSGGSLPIYMQGDGFKKILVVALLAVDSIDGLLLLEEPETYQHPGSRRLLAKFLWHQVRQRSQVVLSTHSIELIDDILAAQAETNADLSLLTVHQLALENGKLRSLVTPGSEVRVNRESLMLDLR